MFPNQVMVIFQNLLSGKGMKLKMQVCLTYRTVRKHTGQHTYGRDALIRLISLYNILERNKYYTT